MLYLDLAGLRHRHGDEWNPMEEVEASSPAALDPERKLSNTARIYRCRGCDVEISVETGENEIRDR